MFLIKTELFSPIPVVSVADQLFEMKPFPFPQVSCSAQGFTGEKLKLTENLYSCAYVSGLLMRANPAGSDL